MERNQDNRVIANYHESTVDAYQGNPFIEGLPPITGFLDDTRVLRPKVKCTAESLHENGVQRAHNISRIIDDFFQPLSQHQQLHERLSLMIRGGYVGRNPDSGDWAKHIQNGYERVVKGELKAFKFSDTASTAQSMTLIGGSGNGKTTAINQLLSLYPQVIYHPKMNLEQVVYLKIDCSHNGSRKEICQNFFRAMDRTLRTTNYERQYSGKRHGEVTLLAMMAQVANAHALGVLIIDEIQHLRTSDTGDSEKALNFFVTLVNTIGLPVILIGTPKARGVFEKDMRSARRLSGLGALFWDPMDNGEEWRNLTDKLWKLQWLQKRDEVLGDELRDVWYDLSQGVLDVVVKLFVLSQLRAIALGVERITEKLMQQVYLDDLKPIHPMLEALRSGDPQEIDKYADIELKDTDKRILAFQRDIAQKLQKTPDTLAYEQLRTGEEKRVYMALKEEFDSSLLAPMIVQLFDEYPTLSWVELMPVVHEHLMSAQMKKSDQKTNSTRTQKGNIKLKEWNTLSSNDLRFVFSQCESADEFHNKLIKSGVVLNIDNWMKKTV
ncbi:AAA family ATPase [Alteromonadaceae bacterium M269]|nr:AAA family ATPase [Alteromonadaceae bacterium M269]